MNKNYKKNGLNSIIAGLIIILYLSIGFIPNLIKVDQIHFAMGFHDNSKWSGPCLYSLQSKILWEYSIKINIERTLS